jgi:hypothetical protein
MADNIPQLEVRFGMVFGALAAACGIAGLVITAMKLW